MNCGTIFVRIENSQSRKKKTTASVLNEKCCVSTVYGPLVSSRLRSLIAAYSALAVSPHDHLTRPQDTANYIYTQTSVIVCSVISSFVSAQLPLAREEEAYDLMTRTN